MNDRLKTIVDLENYPIHDLFSKKTQQLIKKCKDVLYEPPYNMPDDDIWIDPPQCMPEEYKVENDSIKAYWNFYINGKKHIANKNEKIHTKQL